MHRSYLSYFFSPVTEKAKRTAFSKDYPDDTKAVPHIVQSNDDFKYQITLFRKFKHFLAQNFQNALPYTKSTTFRYCHQQCIYQPWPSTFIPTGCAKTYSCGCIWETVHHFQYIKEYFLKLVFFKYLGFKCSRQANV